MVLGQKRALCPLEPELQTAVAPNGCWEPKARPIIKARTNSPKLSADVHIHTQNKCM